MTLHLAEDTTGSARKTRENCHCIYWYRLFVLAPTYEPHDIFGQAAVPQPAAPTPTAVSSSRIERTHENLTAPRDTTAVMPGEQRSHVRKTIRTAGRCNAREHTMPPGECRAGEAEKRRHLFRYNDPADIATSDAFLAATGTGAKLYAHGHGDEGGRAWMKMRTFRSTAKATRRS